MFLKTMMLIGMFALVVTSISSVVLAQKPSAPVRVEYDLPATIQTGDEISTVIRLTAESDLVQILVSVSPGEGLEILSTEKVARFLDVKGGQTREFGVKVRLTDPKEGFLNIFAATTTRFETRSEAVVIPYEVTEKSANP